MNSDEVNEILAVELARVAESDLVASKTLLEKGLYPQAAFMIQQSLEKAIKAILLKLNLVKAGELKKRIGHAIITNSLELIIHRTVLQTVSLLGKMLELLDEVEKQAPEKHVKAISDIRNETRGIIADIMRISSNTIDWFKRNEKDLLKSVEELGELAFNQLDDETKKRLQKAVNKASGLSILDLLSSELYETCYKSTTIIAKLIPMLPEEKRQQFLNMSSEMMGRAIANVVLAFDLFMLMFWYVVFEPSVSSLRYPTIRKKIVQTPLAVDMNTVITEWCREVILYIDRVAMLTCVRELIEGKVKSPKCLEQINVARKYLDIVT